MYYKKFLARFVPAWTFFAQMQKRYETTSATAGLTDASNTTEWENARSFKEIPYLGMFEAIRAYMPGGKYYNMDMNKMFLKINKEFGNVVYIPTLFGNNAMVMTFNPKDFEIAFRNEGIWPIRLGIQSMDFHRKTHRADFFKGVEVLPITVWQNTLMNKSMFPQEMWQYVHDCYGDKLDLTTDDRDYIDPKLVPMDLAIGDTISKNSLTQNFDFSSPISNSIIFPLSGSGSNSSGGVSTTGKEIGGTKIRHPNFFNTKKSSSASANAISGSDNKASDNNSGGDGRKSIMKPYANELTLITAEPDENHGENGSQATTGSASTKEPKSAETDTKRKVSKNTRQPDEALSKNSETIPTDMSNSSDSEGNKTPFVVSAECTSTHEGRQLVQTILPINVDTLFSMLFSKSNFFVDFHIMRKSTDTNFPDWIINEEGQKIRTVNVTVQLTAPIGPKTSKVTEYQVMRDCSKPSELYSIDVETVNADIPYADSFSVSLHYCLVGTVDDQTMLSVHAQIKYKKSIWGMIKGLIEKNVWAGLEDFYTSLLHALQSETCVLPAKSKGRPPKRGVNAVQARPIDDNSVAALAQGEAETAEHLSDENPLFLTHVTSSNPKLVGDLPTSNYRWLSLFVIVFLFSLIAVNNA